MHEYLEHLTMLSYQYGPFFFAILFIAVVTKWTYRNYVSAIQQDPQNPDHVKVTKLTFIVSAAFSLILVVISIVWWFIFQPRVYVFQGQLKGLTDYDVVTSDTLYFKPHVFRLPTGADMRDEHFVAISNEPFVEDQRLEFILVKGEGGNPHRMSIPYSSAGSSQHIIEWDEDKAQPTVQRVSHSAGSNFFGVAHAADRLAQDEVDTGTIDSGQKYISEYLIEALQAERTDVGTKILLLDILGEAGDDRIRFILAYLGITEPMLLTILDLSRHSDPELAHKARKLVEERFDLSAYVKDEFSSGSRFRRDEAIDLLLRMEPDRATAIIEEVPEHFVAPYRARLANHSRYQALVPTGSRQGDRYYVEATWEPEGDKLVDTVECLTKLFNQGLITDRTLEQERELMEGRHQRREYWYSKQRALYIAAEIRRCGAKSAFVSGR